MGNGGVSNGGSEARPLVRRVFNFDNNDLAQACLVKGTCLTKGACLVKGAV